MKETFQPLPLTLDTEVTTLRGFSKQSDPRGVHLRDGLNRFSNNPGKGTDPNADRSRLIHGRATRHRKRIEIGKQQEAKASLGLATQIYI